MTSTSTTSDAWYLDAESYYVASSEASDYPVRQGDVFPGDLPGLDGWHACQVMHPTCELGKAAVAEIQVIRVEPLTRIKGKTDQAKVTVGFAEKDGKFAVAFAHTFFLPPCQEEGPPLFSNFREVATIAREHLTQEKRLAALTHDARVTFIRRALYWRFRIPLTLDETRGLEATRISNDPAFVGPRPDWAPMATTDEDHGTTA